jgi:hypothetical protein
MFKSWPCDRIMPGYDQGIGPTGYLAKLFDGADSFHGRSRKAGKRFLFPMFHCVRGIDPKIKATFYQNNSSGLFDVGCFFCARKEPSHPLVPEFLSLCLEAAKAGRTRAEKFKAA